LEPDEPTRQASRTLVLVPTRELSEQVAACFRALLAYCEKEVTIVNIASGAPSNLLQCAHTVHILYVPHVLLSALLSDKPDIVVATPSRALGALQSKV
jgi:ATP-dependent RNA helicase DDX56/DBP9